MDASQKELIQKIAQLIDEDKYNPILTSYDYDKYLEKVLTELCKGYVELEEAKGK